MKRIISLTKQHHKPKQSTIKQSTMELITMRTSPIYSERSGRPVANQNIIYDDFGNSFFQSYDTIIAKITKIHFISYIYFKNIFFL